MPRAKPSSEPVFFDVCYQQLNILGCFHSIAESFMPLSTIKPSHFISNILTPYSSIGAICESSRWLAREMRGAITCEVTGPIVELGAGYGSVTAILPDSTISIERDPERFEYLRRHFPQRQIYDMCAIEFLNCLNSPSVVISGIPSVNNPEFGNLSAAVKQAQGSGNIIQLITYTYFPHNPFAKIFSNSKMVKLEFRNIPPAFVWRYH